MHSVECTLVTLRAS